VDGETARKREKSGNRDEDYFIVKEIGCQDNHRFTEMIILFTKNLNV